MFDSFGTEIRVKKAMRLAQSYQITSVPTIVVNGKYKTSGSFVSSYDELIEVIDLLIQKELFFHPIYFQYEARSYHFGKVFWFLIFYYFV